MSKFSKNSPSCPKTVKKNWYEFIKKPFSTKSNNRINNCLKALNKFFKIFFSSSWDILIEGLVLLSIYNLPDYNKFFIITARCKKFIKHNFLRAAIFVNLFFLVNYAVVLVIPTEIYCEAAIYIFHFCAAHAVCHQNSPLAADQLLSLWLVYLVGTSVI